MCDSWGCPIPTDHSLQVTVEQQALEEYLLLDPALRTVSSNLLAGRTPSADMVPQVLTQLSSKSPQELWSLVHADAAPAGKAAAKSASAKAAAAPKSKPGRQLNCIALTML